MITTIITSVNFDSAFSLALRSSASIRRHSFSSICRASINTQGSDCSKVNKTLSYSKHIKFQWKYPVCHYSSPAGTNLQFPSCHFIETTWFLLKFHRHFFLVLLVFWFGVHRNLHATPGNLHWSSTLLTTKAWSFTYCTIWQIMTGFWSTFIWSILGWENDTVDKLKNTHLKVLVHHTNTRWHSSATKTSKIKLVPSRWYLMTGQCVNWFHKMSPLPSSSCSNAQRHNIGSRMWLLCLRNI